MVENKILASRMALTVNEQVSHRFDTLRQRTQSLEGRELDSSDILRPDTVCLLLVEQWVEAGLPRTDLQTVVDPLQRELANLLQKNYQVVNVFYVEQGITPQTDLKWCVAPRAAPPRAVAGRFGSGGLASAGPGADPPGHDGRAGRDATAWHASCARSKPMGLRALRCRPGYGGYPGHNTECPRPLPRA